MNAIGLPAIVAPTMEQLLYNQNIFKKSLEHLNLELENLPEDTVNPAMLILTVREICASIFRNRLQMASYLEIPIRAQWSAWENPNVAEPDIQQWISDWNIMAGSIFNKIDQLTEHDWTKNCGETPLTDEEQSLRVCLNYLCQKESFHIGKLSICMEWLGHESITY